MTLKQKFIAVFLSIMFIGITMYLLMNYEQIIDNNAIVKSQYIIDTVPNTTERYKIVNIIYDHNYDKIYAVLHLDNGNFRVLQIEEAYIDPSLKNVNEGYLYRENMQIYIRKE